MENTLKKIGNARLLNRSVVFSNDRNYEGSWREKRQKRKEFKRQKAEKFAAALKVQQQSKKIKIAKEEKEKCNDFTISIAVPGAILENAQSPELKTYLAGQIARAASIFQVHEIIVFSESDIENLENSDEGLKLHKKHYGCIQLVRILQFLECPQYLRKYFFPIHKDLQYAGLINPLNSPHHLKIDDESEYREGVVLDKPVKPGRGSFVYIGLTKIAVIDKVLENNVRVTVKLDNEQMSKKHLKGVAVSPSVPFEEDGIYWGYNVRLARGLKNVFAESPYEKGYDLTIGTSDKGQNIDRVELPLFKHLLVVFGGLKGIESCVEGDESLIVDEPKELFNYYLNTCPNQGLKTIRTEEAILVTMTALRPKISKVQSKQK